MSTLTDDASVQAVKNLACERLLAARVQLKLRSKKVADVANRVHVAVPKATGGAARPPVIPAGVEAARRAREEGLRRKTEVRGGARGGAKKDGGEGRAVVLWVVKAGVLGEWKRGACEKSLGWEMEHGHWMEGAGLSNLFRVGRVYATCKCSLFRFHNSQRDLQEENGGAGVYNADLRKMYDLPADWRYDVMPETLDGHNVADFVDPDIDAKLEALEREEDEMLREWQVRVGGVVAGGKEGVAGEALRVGGGREEDEMLREWQVR